jgi:hypothetical protein
MVRAKVEIEPTVRLDDAFGLKWNEALAGVANPRHFLQYDLIRGMRSHLLADRPNVIAAHFYLDERIVGVCLLEQSTVRKWGLPIRTLSLLVHPHMPQHDIVMAKGARLAMFWRPLVQALDRAGIRWHAIRGAAVRHDSQIFSSVEELASRVVASPAGRSAYFDCSQSHDAIASRYDDAFRKSLAFHWRRLERTGKPEFVTIRGHDEGSSSAFEDFLRLEASGWKGAAGSAIAQSPALVDFYRDLYAMNAEGAWAEIHLLRLDGLAIAGEFCLVSGSVRVAHKAGYDEEFKRLSPGHLSLNELLARSCEDAGIRELNVVGEPAYLAARHPNVVEVSDVWFFRRPLVARVIRAMVRLRSTLASSLRRLRRLTPGNWSRRGSCASAAGRCSSPATHGTGLAGPRKL